jgi:hypothetical protein
VSRSVGAGRTVRDHATSGVATSGGHTTATSMPRGASSLRSASANANTPAFEEPYAV